MNKRDPTSELSEYQRFYLNLGSTISRWQDVEGGLFDVFHRVSTCRSRHSASAIFFAIISFEGKLNMTHDASLVTLDGTPLLAEWIKLSGRVSANAGIRNKLVHFTLNQKAPKNPAAKYHVFLSPNIIDATLQLTPSSSETDVAYNLRQVQDFGEAFAKLGGELTKFAESLAT